MSTRRMISKSISTSKKLSRVSDFEALLFTWLIPHCDDYGRMDGEAHMVKAIVIPLRPETIEGTEAALVALQDIGLIRRYEVEGELYLEIFKWEDHQTFRNDRPRIPKYPPPEDNGNKRHTNVSHW